MTNKEFITKINELNQIFKSIYNSRDKFQNIWNVQDGRFIMHDEKQLPSSLEVIYDSSKLVNAKGIKTKKGLLYDEFVEYFKDNNLSINSVELFNYFKTLDKDNVDIEIKDNSLSFNSEIVSKEYVSDKLMFDSEDVIFVVNLTPDTINEMISFQNNPFTLVFNFDENTATLNEDVSKLDSYLTVRLANKFLPYITSCDKNNSCDVLIEVLSTQIDYMYDIRFTVNKFKISDKGVVSANPIIVRYGIRILEL